MTMLELYSNLSNSTFYNVERNHGISFEDPSNSYKNMNNVHNDIAIYGTPYRFGSLKIEQQIIYNNF
jgi:hypothetical protein